MSLSGNLNDEKNHSRKISFEIKCIIEWWSEFSCRLYFTLITFLIIISKNRVNQSFGCVYYPNIFSVWKKLCSNSIPGKVAILGLLMSECSGDWSDIPNIGGLEQAVPHFVGEGGICHQLYEILGDFDQEQRNILPSQ